MARQIALLRGINLGPNKRLSMSDLRELMHALGYRDAKTLLQSGNVVFTASEGAGTVARRIKDRLARDAGLEVEVLVRTRSEIAKIVSRNPLRKYAKDPKRYLVVFLSAKPKPSFCATSTPPSSSPSATASTGKRSTSGYPKACRRRGSPIPSGRNTWTSPRQRATGAQWRSCWRWQTNRTSPMSFALLRGLVN